MALTDFHVTPPTSTRKTQCQLWKRLIDRSQSPDMSSTRSKSACSRARSAFGKSSFNKDAMFACKCSTFPVPERMTSAPGSWRQYRYAASVTFLAPRSCTRNPRGSSRSTLPSFSKPRSWRSRSVSCKRSRRLNARRTAKVKKYTFLAFCRYLNYLKLTYIG